MIKFRDTGHQARFNVLAADLEFSQGLPKDWASCLFILTAFEYTWKAVSKHVNTRAHEINWIKIRRLPWSRGEEFLMHLAQYLYNGSGKLDLELLWETLDTNNYLLAMSALQIRRSGAALIEGAAA